MLSTDELRKQITTTLTKTKVDKLTHLLETTRFDLCSLADLTFDTDPKLAFRAAWLLENTMLQHRNLPEGFIPYLLSGIGKIKHPGCQRHYAKILMHMTSGRASAAMQYEMLHLDIEPVVNLCFSWIIDLKVLVAVKVHACEALYNLRHRHPVIQEELTAQISYLMRNGSPAMQVRGKRLLGLLSQKPKSKSQNSKVAL